MKYIKSYEEFSSEKKGEEKLLKESEKELNPSWKKISILVPVIVAIITGIFLLFNNFFPFINNENDKKTTEKHYSIILIDHKTFKTPQFRNQSARLKLYHTSPPTIIQVVDGTAAFNTDSITNSIQIEFDNIKNYEFVDREHLLKPGKNTLLIRKK